MIRNKKIILWVLLAIGGFLRFRAISYGLPAVFNADEPHLVNLAVYYGSGDLNPHLFKYPTLWSYLLFFCYGIYYLAWSFFGLWRSVEEFGRLFVRDPSGFYLIARALAALCSTLALGIVYRIGKDFLPPRSALWAALFLAVSPALVESAHAAKPESLMFLFSAASWYFGFKILQEGQRRDYLLCGVFLGLALSTHYTAALQWLILPLAHFLGRLEPKRGPRGYFEALKDSRLWLGLGCAFLAFLAGTPFSILDPQAFLANFQDLSREIQIARTTVAVTEVTRQVLWNAASFAGTWSPVVLALLIGTLQSWISEKKKALFLAVPALVYIFFLSVQPNGGNARYLFPGFTALALLASLGAEAAQERLPSLWIKAGLWLALLAPGIYQCYAFDRQLGLPDTRTLAAEWIKSHIPPGSSLLMDQRHASPPLSMSQAQVNRLYDKTLAMRHPRSRYYRLLLDSHPGGGYEIYQLLRSYASLDTQPGHVDWSRRGYEFLDASLGLKHLQGKVRYVVTTSHGATPENAPELRPFFQQLHKHGNLIQEFSPKRGEVTGPHILIYRL